MHLGRVLNRSANRSRSGTSVQEAALAGAGQRGGLILVGERAVYQAVEAVDLAPAGELDQPDLTGLAGLPADRRAGQDVQVHPEGGATVEAQAAVRLEEVEVRADVDRPARVKLKFLDLDGKAHEEEADGLYATCIQHEIDHLNGVLFIDHISKLKRDRIVKKFTKAAKRAAE